MRSWVCGNRFLISWHSFLFPPFKVRWGRIWWGRPFPCSGGWGSWGCWCISFRGFKYLCWHSYIQGWGRTIFFPELGLPGLICFPHFIGTKISNPDDLKYILNVINFYHFFISIPDSDPLSYLFGCSELPSTHTHSAPPVPPLQNDNNIFPYWSTPLSSTPLPFSPLSIGSYVF